MYLTVIRPVALLVTQRDVEVLKRWEGNQYLRKLGEIKYRQRSLQRCLECVEELKGNGALMYIGIVNDQK